MQKKLFMILFGLVLLISFHATQTMGDEAFNAPAPSAPQGGGNWSAPNYHPEVGDKIIKVNGQRVYDEGDFRRAVRNSPTWIYLGVIDHRSGDYYHLRTRLWSPENQTRLGIYVRTSNNADGVIVTGWWSNSPGMRCQYLKGEITPVHDTYWW